MQLPLAGLQIDSCARQIGAAYAGKLRVAFANSPELMTEPLEVYFEEEATNADSNCVGAFVVLNSAHRVKVLSKKSPSAKVPCLVVRKPLSANDLFLQATAAITRAETARKANFSDKVEAMMAARGHLESDLAMVFTVRALKAAAKRHSFKLPSFVTGPEYHQEFNTSLGLRNFTQAELIRRSDSGVDTLSCECFIKISGRPIKLSRLVNG